MKGDFLKVGKEQFFFSGVNLKLFVGLCDCSDFLPVEIIPESLFVKLKCLGIDMLHVKVMLIIYGGGLKTEKPAGAGCVGEELAGVNRSHE